MSTFNYDVSNDILSHSVVSTNSSIIDTASLTNNGANTATTATIDDLDNTTATVKTISNNDSIDNSTEFPSPPKDLPQHHHNMDSTMAYDSKEDGGGESDSFIESLDEVSIRTQKFEENFVIEHQSRAESREGIHDEEGVGGMEEDSGDGLEEGDGMDISDKTIKNANYDEDEVSQTKQSPKSTLSFKVIGFFFKSSSFVLF